MADYRSFPVPKATPSPGEKVPKSPKLGNTDAIQSNAPPIGPARNPGASPDPMFGREFSAEKDFAILTAASKIRSNAARYGAAVKAGKEKKARLPDAAAIAVGGTERQASVGLDDVGQRVEPSNRRAGLSARGGAGTQKSNRLDNVKDAGAGMTGQRGDGGRGRW